MWSTLRVAEQSDRGAGNEMRAWRLACEKWFHCDMLSSRSLHLTGRLEWVLRQLENRRDNVPDATPEHRLMVSLDVDPSSERLVLARRPVQDTEINLAPVAVRLARAVADGYPDGGGVGAWNLRIRFRPQPDPIFTFCGPAWPDDTMATGRRTVANPPVFFVSCNWFEDCLFTTAM